MKIDQTNQREDFPSHGRGRRFNPYSAHQKDPTKTTLRRGHAPVSPGPQVRTRRDFPQQTGGKHWDFVRHTFWFTDAVQVQTTGTRSGVMTRWFRVYDDLVDDPKVQQLGRLVAYPASRQFVVITRSVCAIFRISSGKFAGRSSDAPVGNPAWSGTRSWRSAASRPR